jgi:hypothetical protein
MGFVAGLPPRKTNSARPALRGFSARGQKRGQNKLTGARVDRHAPVQNELARSSSEAAPVFRSFSEGGRNELSPAAGPACA